MGTGTIGTYGNIDKSKSAYRNYSTKPLIRRALRKVPPFTAKPLT